MALAVAKEHFEVAEVIGREVGIVVTKAARREEVLENAHFKNSIGITANLKP